jgi:nifR3 family TIM-barrel protein
MLSSNEEDKPLGVQLVGENIKDIVEAAKVCEDKGFDMININAACPVPKLKRKGKGVALMNEPEKMGHLIASLTKAVKVPVVLKIRSGFDNNSLNYLEISRIAESEGASAIFIHPRTAESKYAGRLCKEHIIELKQHLKIPIFASGNVMKAYHVIEMLESTGCDGVSIARGSMGQPWIFSQSQTLLDNKPMSEKPPLDEIKQIAQDHFLMMAEIYGFNRALPRMYKHMTWYFAKHKELDPLMRSFRHTVKCEKDFVAFLGRF